MKMGHDESFYAISIRWSGATAQLRRGDEFVADIADVVQLDSERRDVPESEQVVLLLRFGLADGSTRVLFLDSDPVQSNAREVAGHLRRLDEVFDWLLEPGYVARQGDVGIYPAHAVPATSSPIASGDYPAVFEPVLSQRHSLQPVSVCELAAGAGLFHVRALAPIRLVHPEHHAVALEPGLYELRAARGEPLPSFTGLRHGERAALGE
jgi:hypothetical protein